jgi:hypothetical protein
MVGAGHNLNVWLFDGLGIYNAAINYEMWVQGNNVGHAPTDNNKTRKCKSFWDIAFSAAIQPALAIC